MWREYTPEMIEELTAPKPDTTRKLVSFHQIHQEEHTFEDFIDFHPLIYIQDPFGNYIEFSDMDYVPAAECGKPVIYLYPEVRSRCICYC